LQAAWTLVLLAAIAPVAVGLAVAVAVSGDTAQQQFYEAAAQTIPLLVLVLVLERNFVFRTPELQRVPDDPTLPAPTSRTDWIAGALVFATMGLLRASRLAVWASVVLYQIIFLVLLALGEFAALQSLATGHPKESAFALTAGAIASGFAAVIVLSLLGAVRTRQSRRAVASE
jgi:hypothetical protein